MSQTIFDYLNSIFYKKPIENFDSKICNKVLLCYWLSQDKELIEFVNKINLNLWNLDDYNVFKYFYDIIPKKKRFLFWTKKDKEKKKVSKINEEIMLKFHLSDYEERFFGGMNES